MSDSPLFSIIIPTYNRAHMIGTAIDSVLNQSFDDWELIIVDDGSTDGTEQVVRAYKEERVRYYYQENKELNGARNTGVRVARGQYLCFLDDDDYFLPDHLSELYKSIQQEHYPIGAFKVGMIQVEKEQEQRLPLFNLSKRSAIQCIWRFTPNLLSFAFHRSIFEIIKFEEQYLLYEDHHFLYQVFAQFPMWQISSYTVVYKAHPNSRTNTYYGPEYLENKLACIDHLFKTMGSRLEMEIYPEIKRELIIRQFLHFANIAILHQAYGLAKSYLNKATNQGLPLVTIVPFLKTLLKLSLRKRGFRAASP